MLRFVAVPSLHLLSTPLSISSLYSNSLNLISAPTLYAYFLHLLHWIHSLPFIHSLHQLSTYTTKYVNIKSTTVYVPSSELGLFNAPPLSPASAPPPEPKRGGHTRLCAGEGLGESQFRRLRKRLALCLLCDLHLLCTLTVLYARHISYTYTYLYT